MHTIYKTIINKINDISIKGKFLIIYMVCILFPMILVYGIFFSTISDEIKKREAQDINQSMNRVYSDLSSILNSAVNISNGIYLDVRIYELIETDYKTEGSYFDSYQAELRDKLDRYAIIYNNILKLSLYSTNDSVIFGGGFYKLNEQDKKQEWFTSDYEIRNGNFISGYQSPNSLDNQRYSTMVSIRRCLNEYKQYNKFDKYLKIDIDIQKFIDLFKREKIMNFLLVDQNDKILCSSSKNYPMSHEIILKKYNPKDFDESSIILVNNLNDNNNGWRLIGISSRNQLLENIKKFGYFILALFFMSILFSTVFITFITHSYNYRIKKLSQHMDKIKERKFELIELKEGKDEIGILINNFNLMTETINTLINNELKHQILQKDYELESKQAEINFLQSQMNPHFLFNTLNAILVVCTKNHYEDITEIIKYLSKTLRRLLSWDNVMVTVEEEVNFIEMYLKIEKFRFMDKFNYSIKIDEECSKSRVPKMSIQPLVENACEHGIQAIRAEGHVLIKVTKFDDYITVHIEDNGKGMSKEKVDEILYNIRQEKGNSNIGVRNVYRRLKLYYGEGFEFLIDSEPNRGTIVEYKIPFDAFEVMEDGNV